MYIAKVLVEHPSFSLDTTFDYLSSSFLKKGIRVLIPFRNRKIIGYVEDCEETSLSSQELEKRAGFRYQHIISIIDEEPLLNKELQKLAEDMAKLTLSPRITCLQAMLPTQLKPSTHKSVSIKTKKMVRLIKKGTAKTSKQNECLNYLYANPYLLLKDIPFSKNILDKLQEQGFVSYEEVEDYRNPLIVDKLNQSITLTLAQQEVVNSILSHPQRISLIHGVTGSGKTEVYLALAKEYIEKGKGVIMLVPEISLTPMMVKVFKERFGEQVAILHSRLSQGEKYDEYRRIKRQEVKIVVGARSAIFAPLENIGIIILDEEHDPSYKQETSPRYLTSQIAKMRAKYHHCSVVLGSATPSLESYSRAMKGIYDLYVLDKRVHQQPMPSVEIIDMVQEMKQGRYSLFSKSMQKMIQKTIDGDEQVILFLNKRGYANYVQCLDCGEVIKCPHCDVSLTYHKDTNRLKCHYCDYSIPYIKKCPHCQQQSLKIVGYGTQKVEEEIKSSFPNAKVIRYDVDTTRKKNGHQELLTRFKNKEANILLGTQMIAKGLDFENVTFVGVINADMSLNIPDFRASERTFQLLCQVAGRCGRGKKEGKVLIQTYNPSHYAITCAAKHDFVNFYNKEMSYRKIAKYPPFCHLTSILIQSKDEQLCHAIALEIHQYLQLHLKKAQVLGPSLSGIYKMQDIYRNRILLKFIDSQEIYVALNAINDYYNKKGHGKVKVVCDMNPYTQI